MALQALNDLGVVCGMRARAYARPSGIAPSGISVNFDQPKTSKEEHK